MTPLAQSLIRRIGASGPISVAEFMAECLLHPQHGYYSTRDPFGTEGDFVTAPEISQMFGELLGLALAQAWLDQGRPERFLLAELGPGRGTLMADLLRAAARVPGFAEAAELHLIEASPVLRKMQSERISQPLVHHDTLSALAQAPLFLVANEFFDAMPIRQFERRGDLWHERQIGAADGKLAFGLSGPVNIPALNARHDARDGDIVELGAAGETLAAELGGRIARDGGVALIFDYGDWRSLGDTLQALWRHRFDDPLAHPGQADLTAHVDFGALTRAASPAQVTAMTPQGVFLERLGITERAQNLARGLKGEKLEAHIQAHRRLTHPDEMGNLFKTIAIYPTHAPVPAGYST